MKSVLTAAGVLLLAILILVSAAWSALSLFYSDFPGTTLRSALAGLFCVFALAVLVALASRRWRLRALASYVIVFALVLVRFFLIEPSNDRDWKQEVAQLPRATIDGNKVTVRNIRNFHYRTEADFTPGYYDRAYDLRLLDSVDLVTSYWAGPAIAHVFLSFGFGPQGRLAISIERRDERGEAYSTIKGLFRRYELFYVVADERDVIRLRTNIRSDPPEDVYIFRLQGPVESGRRLFLEYMKKINALGDTPEFYNTLTTNCTGNIWLHSRVNPGRVPYSWKILLSGHVPEYLHGLGKLDTSLSFPELMSRSRVNVAAKAAGDASDFSRRIRVGLPGMKTAAPAN